MRVDIGGSIRVECPPSRMTVRIDNECSVDKQVVWIGKEAKFKVIILRCERWLLT